MTLILKNAIILDVKKQQKIQRSIVIDSDGNIQHVFSSNEIETYLDHSTEAKVMDCEGYYISPGLINAHAHLFASGKPSNKKVNPTFLKLGYKLLSTKMGNFCVKNIMKRNALIELQNGVTTLRSLGDFFYQDVSLRDEFIQKRKVAPTLLVAGFFLSTTDGHGAPYLALEGDSPWEGRKNVRKNIKKGVDWIKICVTGGVTDAKKLGEASSLQLTEEEVKAICFEAHKNNTSVAAHVESTEGVRIALKGGVDTIEHGAEMDEEIIELFKNNPYSLKGYSSLVPTFQAAAPFALLKPELTGLNNITYINGKSIYYSMLKGYQQALGNNISFGIGNDASMSFVTHYDFWRELRLHKKLSSQNNLDYKTLSYLI